MKNLNGLPTADLIAEYNQHSGKPPIAKWKRKVSDLVALLLKIKPELYTVDGPKPSERMTDFEAPADELAAQSGRAVDHAEPIEPTGPTPKKAKPKPAKAVKKAAKKAAKESGVKRGAIRELCESLILKVKGTDPATKRPMGLPYSEILDQVKARYPEADTSINCLRWYSTKLNKQTGKDKVVMPIRPKTAKAKAA